MFSVFRVYGLGFSLKGLIHVFSLGFRVFWDLKFRAAGVCSLYDRG